LGASTWSSSRSSPGRGRVARLGLAALPAARTFGSEDRFNILAERRGQRPFVTRRCLEFGQGRSTAMVERPGQRVPLGLGRAQRCTRHGQAAFRIVARGRGFGTRLVGFG
jgi:hypothetical protein